MTGRSGGNFFIRFDFDIFQLSGGLGLIPVLVGLFALTEVFTRLSDPNAGQIDFSTTASGFKVHL